MTKYVKLQDGRLIYAPKKITDGDTITYNPTAEMLLPLGYKPLRVEPMPEVEEGYHLEPAYTAGDRYRHEGVLYRCIQSHTSQADWTPDKTPALWTVVSLDEWPEWKQPAGAHDAYMKGDKVSHNGKHWVCDMDYCTYEPGVYGWTTMED